MPFLGGDISEIENYICARAKSELDNEKNFSALVFSEAKMLFTHREKKYLAKSRMEKLVAFIAQDLKYNDLTRGWYKFGLFAPATWLFCRKSSNLDDLVIPYQSFPQELSNAKPKIKKSILKFHDMFVKDEDTFYEWVYNNAPKEYRRFYFSKKMFENHLNKFELYFETRRSELENEYLMEIDSVSEMYQNINHVTDDETIDLFHSYMDLLEMSLIRLRKLDFIMTEENINFLKNMINTYKGKFGLLNLLVPFKQTLEGINSEYWTRWMDKTIKQTKIFLSEKIEDLHKEAMSLDLLPSMKELENDSKKLERGKRKSIREMSERVGV